MGQLLKSHIVEYRIQINVEKNQISVEKNQINVEKNQINVEKNLDFAKKQ